MVLHLLLIKGGMKTENGKVKTENYPPPPPTGLSARRNGNCDPQRAQNDIESFF